MISFFRRGTRRGREEGDDLQIRASMGICVDEGRMVGTAEHVLVISWG